MSADQGNFYYYLTVIGRQTDIPRGGKRKARNAILTRSERPEFESRFYNFLRYDLGQVT